MAMDQLAIEPPSADVFITREVPSASPKQRETILRSVGNNVFAFPAALTTVDLLSDSGTSAMSDMQWAALFRGDESYGRNTGYFCLLDAFRDVFERGKDRKHSFRIVLGSPSTTVMLEEQFIGSFEGGFVNGGEAQILRPNFFILPQGRCAEHILFSTLYETLSRRGAKKNQAILSNGFFDTTRANASSAGFELQTFCEPAERETFELKDLRKRNSFRGNLDIDTSSEFLAKNPGRVAMILVSVTNNWAAGQPVSMANIKAASQLAARFGVPIFIDACRFAENAKFIKDFETGYHEHSIPEIVQEMFSHVDGFTISLKKDGLSNIGGALCFRDAGRFAEMYPDIGKEFRVQQIMTYGNDSYGGMSGRDMMAATVGLYESTNETHLSSRIEQVRKLAEKLAAAKIPVIMPTGGSAVFLDMDEFFKDCGRSYGEFAALGFTLQLLILYGVRCFEAGPFAWEWDRADEQEKAKVSNLVRLAIPRKALTDKHLDYVVAAIERLFIERSKIPGVEITHGATLKLRHFQCTLKLVPRCGK